MQNQNGKIHEIMMSAKNDFEMVSVEQMNFQREFNFAIQAIEKNEYAKTTAMNNPKSVKNAIVNIAAIGLTLNPAERLSYLVPRDGAIHLDISYIGLLKLAVMDGGITWAIANTVRKNDTFKLKGFGQEPVHEFDPFSNDRGDIVGAYCTAKTPDGSFLTTVMSYEEINSIRDRTSGWKAFESKKAKSSVWNTDYEEMAKKTVIKRASKTFPRAFVSTSRLNTAIEVINQHEGIDFESEKKLKKVSNESTLLNEALTPKTITEDRTKHNEVIQNIYSLCKTACSGFNDEEKKTFMEVELKMTKNEIQNATMEDLLNLEAFLLERYGDLKWED
jgi:recombination protein RecT